MKQLMALSILAFGMLFLLSPFDARAEVRSLGKIEAFGGAEKEEGSSAGGRGGVELLGTLPLIGGLGFQGIGHYVGGSGSRFGFSGGPLYDWGSLATGLFVAYQYRSHNENHFAHLRPSITFYMPQSNINVFYSHPISSPQRDDGRVEYGINQLQGTFNYFPPFDLSSYLHKDNVEFSLGLQANSFAGAGSRKLEYGIGPVFGFSFTPAARFEVNLLRGTIDHQGRYRVGAGVSFNFSEDKPTLKEIRRRYLEPNFFSPNGVASPCVRRFSHRLGICDTPLAGRCCG